MSQLVPFYFVNEITFTFIILAITVNILSGCKLLVIYFKLLGIYPSVILGGLYYNVYSLIYGISGHLTENTSNYVSNGIVPNSIRHYSSLNTKSTIINNKKDKLNPSYVTGFSDAESYFGVVVTKSKTIKLG
jgi:hypothetical protein